MLCSLSGFSLGYSIWPRVATKGQACFFFNITHISTIFQLFVVDGVFFFNFIIAYSTCENAPQWSCLL